MKYFIGIFVFMLFIAFANGCAVKQAGDKATEQIMQTGLLNVKNQAEKDAAIAKAKAVYTGKIAQSEELENGPCLSDNLLPDWVADIAHNPRQPVDDLPENQCPAFGKTAHHFVELDPNGNLIRVL